MGRFVAGFLFAVLIACSAQAQQTSPAADTVDLRQLLAATKSSEAALSLKPERLNRFAQEIPKDSASRPISTFLLGETFRLRHETKQARELYRSLVEWAAASQDGWGGSGLAAVALWRWLQFANADPSPDPEEAARLLAAAGKLLDTRLTQRMFQADVLTSLPQLQETILRQLTELAWKAQKKEEAARLFLEYLAVATDASFTPIETEIKDQALASGSISLERLLLFRAKRLHALAKFDDASALFTEVQKGKDAQARVEANFYLAQIQRDARSAPRTQIAQLLESIVQETSDPNVAQDALLYRARMFLREGSGQDSTRALQDLNRIVQDYPTGTNTDEALLELARYHLESGNLDEALKYFEQLRNFSGTNDWINLASFQPAIALYGRGKPEDLESAASLLIGLEKLQPTGPLHLANLFWLGRIAQDRGQQDLSRTYFLRVITEAPYDYYALRARIHLNAPEQASKQLWLDAQSADQVQKEYRASKIRKDWQSDSPYHLRLRQALEGGLYGEALNAGIDLRVHFPSRRAEDLTLAELDDSGFMASLSLLLALRQDAFAAKDAVPTAENRLQIAAAAGNTARDWPLTMNLVISRLETQQNQFASQRDDAYLATAYPPVFHDAIASVARKRNVEPELLYGIMRRESFFNPYALSKNAALGLFQFLPVTFDALNRRWNLIEKNDAASRQAFLLNPESSIDLGARWFKNELLERENGDIVLAIMEHHAGYPAVKSWKAGWQAVNRGGDLEYEIDTARFAATRLFVRDVVTDLSIIRASRIFEAP